jgi:hypothetical protein
LVLAGDPNAAQPLGAATKQYVDAPVSALWQNIRYRNRIINGDMSLDQRNGGASVAMGGGIAYAIDRWRFQNIGSVVPSVGSYGQIVFANPQATWTFPYQYYLRFSTSTAYPTPAAGAAVLFTQVIEGHNFLDAQWGGAAAQPITIEFWAIAAVAGTYSFTLQNAAATRSYVTTFTISSTAGWNKIRMTIPGDTGGTWAVAPNAAMLALTFGLCVGSTYSTATLNAWQNGNFVGATGAVNVLATIAPSAFGITGVALMVGAAAANAAAPEFLPFAENLRACQRYFALGPSFYILGYGAAGTGVADNWTAPVTMRAAPTVTFTWTNTVNTSGASVTAQGDARTISASFACLAAGGAQAVLNLISLSADF